MARPHNGKRKGKSRAFSGLGLVFVLSFVNLGGIILTLSTLGGLEPWTGWQFVGLFGVIEASAGLSNINAPNIWRLPVAEMQTSKRTQVRLAVTTLLMPHWAGGARALAGLCLIGASGFHAGWTSGSLLLLPLLACLTVMFLGVSAAIARFGVALPEADTVQFVVRWGKREMESGPLSVSASIQQFVLGVLTLPAVKLLEPGGLFGPELRPSMPAVAACAAAAGISVLVTAILWSGRIQWRAPREQQREAELNA